MEGRSPLRVVETTRNESENQDDKQQGMLEERIGRMEAEGPRKEDRERSKGGVKGCVEPKYIDIQEERL